MQDLDALHHLPGGCRSSGAMRSASYECSVADRTPAWTAATETLVAVVTSVGFAALDGQSPRMQHT